EQLDSDSFAQRQAASDKLGRMGQPAVAALAKAAAGDSLEVTVRAVDILRSMLKSADEATQAAARTALEELVRGGPAAAAGRAARALQPAEEPLPPGAMLPPAARLMPGGAIQIAVGGAGVRRVSVRTINGVKTIEAEEGDQKIKIVDSPNQGIKVEVTAKKDGKDVTETYEAKNAEELKKQHPEAHKIYHRYGQMGGMGGIAVQMQMQMGGNVQPVPAAPADPIQVASKALESWGKSLDLMATDRAIQDAAKESNEELKKTVGTLKEQLEKLEKRLQQAIEKPNGE
ncbi:MAG: hypothetical protein U1E05_12075, partial [Patescibacteria group bacterium]|nr:hypothetical protein [Patescibacteria group bacterium]